MTAFAPASFNRPSRVLCLPVCLIPSSPDGYCFANTRDESEIIVIVSIYFTEKKTNPLTIKLPARVNFSATVIRMCLVCH